MSDQPEALRLADVPICQRSLEWQSNATAELRRLHAEVERLRADAERYQWLRARYRAMSMDMGGNHSWVPDGRVMRELRGPTLNAAIDAALKEPK